MIEPRDFFVNLPNRFVFTPLLIRMKKIVGFTCLFLLAGLVARGQTISIGELPNSICVDTDLQIPVTTTGAFATGNSFRVQLRSLYQSNIATYPATLVGNKLSVVLKDVPFSDFDFSSNFQLRVVSTDPVVETAWATVIRLLVPPSATLSAVNTVPVNPYEDVPLRLVGRGSAPVTVTLNDSINFITGSNVSNGVSFDAVKIVQPVRSQVFRLTGVRNGCGTGPASGSVDVRVNPVAIRIASLANTVLCEGSTLYVNYEQQGGLLQPGNAFKIRLAQQTDPTRVLTLDATLENGLLRTTIPITGVGTSGRGIRYEVRVVTTQPAVVSAPASVPIVVYPAPSARITTASTTLNVGDFANIFLEFGGIPPFSVTMSDGQVNRFAIGDFRGTVSVRPTQTTSYSIAAFSSGCGTTKPDPGVVQVTVRPGIRIDLAPSGPVCNGTTQQLQFSTNVTLSPKAEFRVQPFVQRNPGLLFPSVPATRTGNKLTFVLQTDQPASNENFIDLRVSVTDGPDSYTAATQLYVLRKPMVIITQPRAVTVAYLDEAFITASYLGGGPYRVVLSDGSVVNRNTQGSNLYSNITFAPLSTGRYTVREVSNGCFTSTGADATAGEADITVTRVPDLAIALIEPVPDPGFQCPRDSVQVRFQGQGSFAASNVFQVQLLDRQTQTWQPLATGVQPGVSVKVSLPAGYQQIRIASTNPIVYSQTRTVPVSTAPVGTLTKFYEPEPPIIGETRTLQLNVRQGGQGPFVVIFSDGETEFRRVFSGENFLETVPMTKAVTYTLKSLQDACGTGSVSGGSVSFVPAPLRVRILNYNNNGDSPNLCVGGRITVPFAVEGQATAGTLYTLQMASVDSAFVTAAGPVAQSPFVLDVPRRPSGQYRFRVVTQNPDVATESVGFELRNKPTAQLTTDDGSNRIASESGRASLRINLTTDRLPARVVFTDGFVGEYSYSPAYREVNVTRPTTFSLQSVTGFCGYGAVSGQVVASVKPSLALRTTPNACVGQPVSLTATVGGEFSPTNLFRLDLLSASGQVAARLDSGTQLVAVRSVRLPAGLTSGQYQIRLTASAPALVATASVRVDVPARLSLSGNTVIVAGQTTFLAIRATGIGSTVTTLANDDITFALNNEPPQTRSWYGPLTLVAVAPTQTTTYRLTQVLNACGAGQADGQAVVTVDPASANRVEIRSVNGYSGLLPICSGDTLLLAYAQTGTLPATTLIVQLSDSTGNAYTDLPTTVSSATVLRAILPATLPRGSNYRLRLRPTDAAVASGAYPYPLTVRSRATARFGVSTLVIDPGKPVQIPVLLGGDGPWRYRIAADLASLSQYAQKSVDTISVQVVSPVAVFRLVSVNSEGCGPGTVGDPSVIRVELVTAIEPGETAAQVWPNPVLNQVQIRWPTPAPYTVRLLSPTGATLLTRYSRQQTDQFDLTAMPTGVYLLIVEKEGQLRQTFRLVKQ